MKTRKSISISLTISIMLALPTFASADELSGSEWRPSLIGTLKIPESTELFIKIKCEGKLAGHGGCNQFFGTYSISGNKIDFGPIGSTRMACEKLVMDLESTFLSTLDDVEMFQREKTELEFSNAKGKQKIRLIQTDWD
jgi:heat shock protein HslJ